MTAAMIAENVGTRDAIARALLSSALCNCGHRRHEPTCGERLGCHPDRVCLHKRTDVSRMKAEDFPPILDHLLGAPAEAC